MPEQNQTPTKLDLKKLCWAIRGQKGTPAMIVDALTRNADIPTTARDHLITAIQSGHMNSQLIAVDAHWNVSQNPDKRIHTIAHIHIREL